MERGCLSEVEAFQPVTGNLPALDAAWTEIAIATDSSVVAICVTAAVSIAFVFAKDAAEADTRFAAGRFASLRGIDINYEIPAAGKLTDSRPKLYVRALEKNSVTASGLTFWPLIGKEA